MPAPAFQPQDPAFEQRVRASFARRKAMDLIGATGVHDAKGTHVASLQQTLMTLPDTPDTPA